MSNATTPSLSYRVSARAALAALGLRLQQLTLFGPVSAQVHIDQKQVKHPPTQK
jgi:hypothetical protein